MRFTYLIIVIYTFVFTACGESPKSNPVEEIKADTTVLTRTTTFERDYIHRDAIRSKMNQRDPDDYIYDWDIDEANLTEQVPRTTVKPISNDSIDLISYEVSARNRPPLFNAKCLEAEDPMACSNQSLRRFVKTIVDELRSEYSFTREYEMVTFIVDQKGKILADVFIAPQEEPCPDCNKVAVQVIKKMNDWVPAFKDGMPVSVRVQVPIRLVSE